MSAENVWKCIKNYRGDAAKRLVKKFGTESACIKALQSYSDKGKYHGHGSGKGGDGTNAGADLALNTAVAFLGNAVVPAGSMFGGASSSSKAGTSAAGAAAKAKNKATNAEALDIIRNGDHLGKIQSDLNEAMPGWQDVRVIKKAYDLKKQLKKNKKK